MRNWVGVIVSTATAAWLGCGGAQQPPSEPGLAPHHAWRLYPLLENSAWSYDIDSGDGDPILAITRVQAVHGNRVEVVTGNRSTFYELRQDGIVTTSSGAYLLKMPITVGATWPSGGDHTATVTAVDVALETPAGRYQQCVAIDEVGAESGLQVRTTYCPDVGPVEVDTHMQIRGETMRVVARLRGFQSGGG